MTETTLELPTLIATSVVRGAEQGDSHGGIYLVDFANQEVNQVVDWDSSEIDFQFGSPVTFGDLAGDVEAVGHPIEVIVRDVAESCTDFDVAVGEEVTDFRVRSVDGFATGDSVVEIN